MPDFRLSIRPLNLVFDFIGGDKNYWKQKFRSSLSQISVIGNLIRMVSRDNDSRGHLIFSIDGRYRVAGSRVTGSDRIFERQLFKLLCYNINPPKQFWDIHCIQITRHGLMPIRPNVIVERHVETLRHFRLYRFSLDFKIAILCWMKN